MAVAGGEPIPTELAGWRKAEGNPTMTTRGQHISAEGSVIGGARAATVGRRQAASAVGDVVPLIEERLTITPTAASPSP